MEYSFSASGWLFIYQLGVAKALQENGLHKEKHCIRCTGSSGGSLVSACLAVDINIDLIKDFFLDCVADCKKNPTVNMFKMREYVKGAFELANKSFAERSDGDQSLNTFHEHHSVRNGRLGVSVTLLPSCNNAIITEFNSQEELEQAILGSCTMSPLAGMPFRMHKPDDPNVHGKWVFDGGMANIQPHTRTEDTTEKVVTVSPFYFWDSDIKPSKYIPIWWGLFPPSVEEMNDLFELGVIDAVNWLKKNPHLFEEDLSSAMVSVSQETAQSQVPSIPVQIRNSNIYLSGHDDPVKRLRKVTFGRTESNLQADGFLNRALDKAAIFTQKSIVKSLAVSTIYVELAAMASFNAVKGAGVALEKKRRARLSQSKSFFSIRRWLPQHLLGSATGSISDSAEHVEVLLRPKEIWNKVDKKVNEGTMDDSEKCELSEKSFVFRRLIHYLI